MARRLFGLGAVVALLALLAATPASAAEPPAWSLSRFWQAMLANVERVVSLAPEGWMVKLGPEMDPNGLATQPRDLGPGMDPDGLASSPGDLGPGMDPNGAK